MELLLETPDSGVSNEVVPSDRYSPEDMHSDFGGMVGRRSRTERSDWDHLYFFSKKCKHKSVIELCTTFVRFNRVYLKKCVRNRKTFQNKTYLNFFGMKIFV